MKYLYKYKFKKKLKVFTYLILVIISIGLLNCERNQDDNYLISFDNNMLERFKLKSDGCILDGLKAKIEINGNSNVCNVTITSESAVEGICKVKKADKLKIKVTYIVENQTPKKEVILAIMKSVIDLSDNNTKIITIDFSTDLNTETDYSFNDDHDPVPNLWEVCQGFNPLNDSEFPPEICDGHDNDGDGETDESFLNPDNDYQTCLNITNNCNCFDGDNYCGSSGFYKCDALTKQLICNVEYQNDGDFCNTDDGCKICDEGICVNEQDETKCGDGGQCIDGVCIVE